MTNEELLCKFEESVKKTDREHTFGNFKEYEKLFQEVLDKMNGLQRKGEFEYFYNKVLDEMTNKVREWFIIGFLLGVVTVLLYLKIFGVL